MMEFIKWFFVGYFFIGFFLAGLGVIATNTNNEVKAEIRKDGDPLKVPYWISIGFLFVMIILAWPLLLAKIKIRRDG